jgi:hypothetical protein
MTDSEPPIFLEEIELGRERLRIDIKRWQGRWIFSAWKFWETKEGEWRPGKHGISVSVERLPQLADAVSDALAKAKSEDILR